MWCGAIHCEHHISLISVLYLVYIYILVERGSDGLRVTYWYHRQFVESAKERYCKDEETVKLMHATVAEYFIGTWSDGILGCFYSFVF